MMRFEMREVREAMAYAGQGYQALHTHTLDQGHPLFRRYPVIAHLFDQNRDRLILTAKSLGVRVIKVERDGQPGQHIDLCGKPFDRANAMCVAHVAKCESAADLFNWITEPSPLRFDS